MSDTTHTESTASVRFDVPHLQALADSIVNIAHAHTVDAVTLATVALAEVLKAHDGRLTDLEAELFRLKSGSD